MVPSVSLLAVSKYLDVFQDAASFSGALPIVGLLMMTVLAVLIPTWSPSRWIAFSLILLFVTLQRPEETFYHDMRMSYLVQPAVGLSRQITVALLGCLAVGGIFISRGSRRKIFDSATLTFLAIQMLVCAKTLSEGLIDRAVLSFIVFMTTYIGIVIGIGCSIQKISDCNKVLWSILAGVAAIDLLTIHELIVKKSGVVINNRLFAVAVNPQTAGTTFALTIVLVCYLLTCTKGMRSNLVKPFLIGMLGFTTIFLLWTGSRTGLLSAFVGISILFYDKISSLALVLLLLVGTGFVASQVFEDSLDNSDRLLSTKNTRANAWSRMIETYKENPVWGSKIGRSVSAGESSYLSAAANMGTIGVIFITGLVISFLIFCYKLLSNRHLLGEHARLACLIVSGVITILVASILDDYLLGTTSFQTYFLYAYLTVGTFLLEYINQAKMAARNNYVPNRNVMN